MLIIRLSSRRSRQFNNKDPMQLKPKYNKTPPTFPNDMDKHTYRSTYIKNTHLHISKAHLPPHISTALCMISESYLGDRLVEASPALRVQLCRITHGLYQEPPLFTIRVENTGLHEQPLSLLLKHFLLDSFPSTTVKNLSRLKRSFHLPSLHNKNQQRRAITRSSVSLPPSRTPHPLTSPLSTDKKPTNKT